MKRILIASAVLAVLAGCSSAPKDTYERRSYEEQERKEKAMNTILDKTPDWCKKPKNSSDAVYACGESDGDNKSMTEHKATLDSFGKICMAAGGVVNQQSKTFQNATTSGTVEQTTRAIQALCPSVDMTGVEIREPKTIVAGGKYYSWVEVALPTGDANRLKKAKINEQLLRDTDRRAKEEFREMDKRSERAQQ